MITKTRMQKLSFKSKPGRAVHLGLATSGGPGKPGDGTDTFAGR